MIKMVCGMRLDETGCSKHHNNSKMREVMEVEITWKTKKV